jgi:hypothetical protein
MCMYVSMYVYILVYFHMYLIIHIPIYIQTLQRYAEVTYSNLRDKKNGMDQDSEEVATGAHNLANVIYRLKGDIVRAEKLARESLRITTLISSISLRSVGIYCTFLAQILMEQSNVGDETRELFERSIDISIKENGLDSFETATANMNIGAFYRSAAITQPTVALKHKQLLLAKSHYKESLRIFSLIHGPRHPNTTEATSRLASVTRELS